MYFIKIKIVALSFLVLLPIFLVTPIVDAAEPIPEGCPGSSKPTQPAPQVCATIPLGCPGSSLQGPIASPPQNCPYEKVGSELEAASLPTDCKDSDNLHRGNCEIIDYLVIFINALSAIVGIVVVIMIVVGGIQYSTARDNPQAVQAAKGRITNAIISLLVYLFFYAFLQYLIPGGIF